MCGVIFALKAELNYNIMLENLLTLHMEVVETWLLIPNLLRLYF